MHFDRAARLAACPRPTYDEALPVVARREEIMRALTQHQVLVVCGETGSGKTTQLPKICLEAGRGIHARIGHTQPRRIAARATAARIAQELGSDLGVAVGYKIRFSDRVSPESYIKLMTDGILLAETQQDPQLRQYDTLIIDEAHERSINIDFLLGYVRQLLPRRPDLKLIITSATLDAQGFSRHFDNAPVIEVSGRLYPIEIRYRPLPQTREANTPGGNTVRVGETLRSGEAMPEAIADAIAELFAIGPGDVLVFLPGEREIRETAEYLRKQPWRGGAPEILPLFARQSAAEQGRVFAAHQGRRVILATNVAETSLTVPGIRYVVDTGLARIKRYSLRNKVEQLQVEPIAQSAARQRAGRCGRVAAGVCIRLYEEADWQSRPAHTEPELLRASLAGVILRMLALGLGDVEAFPFLDAPATRRISDGYQLLFELGAVRGETAGTRTLTPIGQALAKLPVDPKIGRMILAARDLGALREVLVIAAALSVQDPRERPLARQAAADQAHAQWKDERSEFLSWGKLWQASDAVWRHESASRQRQWCQKQFLSWLRLREWRDVHAQLVVLCHEHHWLENQIPASFEAIHKALLSGLLGHIGMKAEDEPYYRGARDIRFYLHPGSALAKKAGRWIVAAELTETSRLYARCIAKIDPAWVEAVGGHLLRRHIFDPHWEKASGQVAAWERVTLFGLLITARRRVAYGGPDASAQEQQIARKLFIENALVAGDVREEDRRRWAFLQHNEALLRKIEKLEHMTRRPDVLVDTPFITAIFDALIPAEVSSVAAFDVWRREIERNQPQRLFLQREQLMRHAAEDITSVAFPVEMQWQDWRFVLSYHHEPGAADDGLTMHLPLAALNQAPEGDWLVPGLLKNKVEALMRTLPQKYRHRLQPLAASAEAFVAQAQPEDGRLRLALTAFIEERIALKLPLDGLRPGELAAHHFLNYRVLDAHGATLAMSRNLASLRSRFGARVAQSYAQAIPVAPAVSTALSPAVDRSGIHARWDFGELPEMLDVTVHGQRVRGFAALADVSVQGVQLRAFDSREEAQTQHRSGLLRLFTLALAAQVKQMDKVLPRQLELLYAPWGARDVLLRQLWTNALAKVCLIPPWPTDASAFAARVDAAKGRVLLVTQEYAQLALTILEAYATLGKTLAGLARAQPAACRDIETQRTRLLAKDFLETTPSERLPELPRYLKAALLRLEKLRRDPVRDARLLAQWQAVALPWEKRQYQGALADPFLEEFRWLLEEFRVALFAQELKTPSPVSAKRLTTMWAAYAAGRA